MMEVWALILYLLARVTLTLIRSSEIIVYFRKVHVQGFYQIIWNFELPSAFLYKLATYLKNSLFHVKNIVFSEN